jgi:hypothetical protein
VHKAAGVSVDVCVRPLCVSFPPLCFHCVCVASLSLRAFHSPRVEVQCRSSAVCMRRNVLPSSTADRVEAVREESRRGVRGARGVECMEKETEGMGQCARKSK